MADGQPSDRRDPVTGALLGDRQHDVPVEIVESKLYRPAVRPGVVPRPGLLARLRAGRDAPTVAIVAPAGFGKTTLLALWAQEDERPIAWLTVDQHDNDPIVLLTHLAVALDRIEPLPADVFDALRSVGVSVLDTVVPRLGAAIARLAHPVAVVVDDVHHLRNGPALDALVSLVDHARGATRVVLAGRAVPVPLARRRAQGSVVQVDATDLAFTETGARSLLRAAGADLADDELADLMQRTEGWAAGLYLAALTRPDVRPEHATAEAGAGDRLMRDFLEAELLAGLAGEDLSFLTRTSVLEQLSGPLCDAVLGGSGSGAELDHLQHENLFLVPLDGHGEWFRYHPVFRELLRTRLDRDGGATVPELLRRAADWCEADGRLEAALRYGREAGDVDRVARIAVALAQPMYAAGRADTVLGWLEWLDERGATGRHPAVAAVGAYVSALAGRPAAADRWADLAESCAAGRPDADEDGVFAMWLATARGMMCRRGVAQMRRDADDARIPGTSADPEYPMRLLISGIAAMLLEDPETAEARLTDAIELADGARRPALSCGALAHRALLHLAREDWSSTEDLVHRAVALTRRTGLESHISSGLVFALAARVALHRDDAALARARLNEAQRVRPLLTHALPTTAVETLLQMAECAIGLGDLPGAGIFLRDAEAVLRRRPDLGALNRRTDELRVRLGHLGTEGGGTTLTLTTAELRILPLLRTHLTLAGIAERLFLSRHTVKSQLWSAYRKLDVHTRGEAVARAQELGLLEA